MPTTYPFSFRRCPYAIVQQDLRERQESCERQNEIERAKFLEFTKTATNEVLNFNNQIASKQKMLEVAENNAIKAAEEWETSIRSSSQETLEVKLFLLCPFLVVSLSVSPLPTPHKN